MTLETLVLIIYNECSGWGLEINYFWVYAYFNHLLQRLQNILNQTFSKKNTSTESIIPEKQQ